MGDDPRRAHERHMLADSIGISLPAPTHLHKIAMRCEKYWEPVLEPEDSKTPVCKMIPR